MKKQIILGMLGVLSSIGGVQAEPEQYLPFEREGYQVVPTNPSFQPVYQKPTQAPAVAPAQPAYHSSNPVEQVVPLYRRQAVQDQLQARSAQLQASSHQEEESQIQMPVPVATPAVVSNGEAVQVPEQKAELPWLQRLSPAAGPAGTGVSVSDPFSYGPVSGVTAKTIARDTRDILKMSGTLLHRAILEPQSMGIADDGLKDLEPLVAKLVSGGDMRIVIQGYASDRAGADYEPRRVALNRVRILRQFFIDNGVPKERINVQALGDRTAESPKDRIDIRVQ